MICLHGILKNVLLVFHAKLWTLLQVVEEFNANCLLCGMFNALDQLTSLMHDGTISLFKNID
jgi:hypothetical protein